MTESDFYGVMRAMIETGFIDFSELVSVIDEHVEPDHPQANTFSAISMAEGADGAVQAINEVWRTTFLPTNTVGYDLDSGFIFANYLERRMSLREAHSRFRILVDSHAIVGIEPEDFIHGLNAFSKQSRFYTRLVREAEISLVKWRECEKFVDELGGATQRVTEA